MELYFSRLALPLELGDFGTSFIASLRMSLTRKKVLMVVKKSDRGISMEYFVVFPKVTSSGSDNRRCARCCHCYVNLALYTG